MNNIKDINPIDLAIYRMEKALGCCTAAVELMKIDQSNSALNRLYYAALHTVRAVNAMDGFDTDNDSKIFSHFNKKYVDTNIFPKEFSEIIQRASIYKRYADYEDFFEAEQDEIYNLLNDVLAFTGTIQEYILDRSRKNK